MAELSTNRVPFLPPQQQSVVEHLWSFQGRWGRVPTVRELGALLGGKSPATVHKLLRRLEGKGYVAREPHTVRLSLLVPPRKRRRP